MGYLLLAIVVLLCLVGGTVYGVLRLKAKAEGKSFAQEAADLATSQLNKKP